MGGSIQVEVTGSWARGKVAISHNVRSQGNAENSVWEQMWIYNEMKRDRERVRELEWVTHQNWKDRVDFLEMVVIFVENIDGDARVLSTESTHATLLESLHRVACTHTACCLRFLYFPCQTKIVFLNHSLVTGKSNSLRLNQTYTIGFSHPRN